MQARVSIAHLVSLEIDFFEFAQLFSSLTLLSRQSDSKVGESGTRMRFNANYSQLYQFEQEPSVIGFGF